MIYLENGEELLQELREHFGAWLGALDEVENPTDTTAYIGAEALKFLQRLNTVKHCADSMSKRLVGSCGTCHYWDKEHGRCSSGTPDMKPTDYCTWWQAIVTDPPCP